MPGLQPGSMRSSVSSAYSVGVSFSMRRKLRHGRIPARRPGPAAAACPDGEHQPWRMDGRRGRIGHHRVGGVGLPRAEGRIGVIGVTRRACRHRVPRRCRASTSGLGGKQGGVDHVDAGQEVRLLLPNGPAVRHTDKARRCGWRRSPAPSRDAVPLEHKGVRQMPRAFHDRHRRVPTAVRLHAHGLQGARPSR